MFLKKPEKRRISPWCAIMIGGLATVGAVSIVTACKESIKEKGHALMSMFGKKEKCPCESSLTVD